MGHDDRVVEAGEEVAGDVGKGGCAHEVPGLDVVDLGGADADARSGVDQGVPLVGHSEGQPGASVTVGEFGFEPNDGHLNHSPERSGFERGGFEVEDCKGPRCDWLIHGADDVSPEVTGISGSGRAIYALRPVLVSSLTVTSSGTLLARAADWAAHLHAQQRRKVSGAPYLAHLVGTAGIAASISGDEVVLAAAFLHDAIEDQRATLEQARTALDDPRADDVWRIVEACTDVADRKSMPGWANRKRVYLDKLEALANGTDPDFVRRVCAVAVSDKLYNARSIEHELRTEGAAAFDRMAGGTDALTWYLPELADHLARLADRSNSMILRQAVAEYAATIGRISRVYGILPRLRDELPIGRAADLALGIENIQVHDPNGDSTFVSVRLHPTRLGRRPGVASGAIRSLAAEQPEFPDAFGGAMELAVAASGYRSHGSANRLAHGLQATAVALEHGCSTSEACATLLVSLRTGRDGVAITSDAVAEALGPDVGSATNTILRKCKNVPRSKRGVPVFGARQAFFQRARNWPLGDSVYRVLVADEIPRASLQEARVRRIPVAQVLEMPRQALEELSTFAVACEARLGDSISRVLGDISARIDNYLDIVRELSDEAARRPAGMRRDDFTVREADGTELHVHVTLTPHPSLLGRPGWQQGEVNRLDMFPPSVANKEVSVTKPTADPVVDRPADGPAVGR